MEASGKKQKTNELSPVFNSKTLILKQQVEIRAIFLSVQLLSHVWLFATPWTESRQASLSITNSRSSLKLMSIKLVVPSNHLILCHPLLLLPSIFRSIGVFSKESVLHIRWPKYWKFSFSISPSNEYSQCIHMPNHWVVGFKYLTFFFQDLLIYVWFCWIFVALRFSRCR